MANPKVSVCILAYNHEAYIAQAIESVLVQRTNFEFELIIGEDCSTDRTRELILDLARENPEQIRLCLAPHNQGAGRNFTNLYKECRGEYVIIFDGDDYWSSPNKLQLQSDALDSHPGWAMCFHPATVVYDDDRPSDLFPEGQTKSEYNIYDLLEKDFMASSAVMFRNRLFGNFPDWFADVVVCDWTLHILNAVHGNVGFVPEPMSVYRIHDGGMFSKKSLEFKIITATKMMTKMDHFLGGKFLQQIDEHRLHTLRWLISQWEHEKRASQQALGDLRSLQARAEQLTAECAQLRIEIQPLKSFYDLWHNSTMYRVYREVARPLNRLRRAG